MTAVTPTKRLLELNFSKSRLSPPFIRRSKVPSMHHISHDAEKGGFTRRSLPGTPGAEGEAADTDSVDGDVSLINPLSPLSIPPSTAAVPINWTMTTLLFLFPALLGSLFGYDIGSTSGALLSMTSPTLSGTQWYALSPLQSGLVVSLSLAGALIGSLGALVYGDTMGRRRELLLASVLYCVSAASFFVAPNLTTVLLGRLLYGLGIGFAMHAAPAYIAETMPPPVRGLFLSLKEACIVGGILAGYALSYVFVDDIGGWRWMYGVAVVPAVVACAGMAWLPESPRWLALSGNVGATVHALERMQEGGGFSVGSSSSLPDRRSDTLLYEEQAQAMIAAARSAATPPLDVPSHEPPPFLRRRGGVLLQDPRYRKPLAIGLSLMFFQQMTGQPSVLYYAAKIFQAVGFADAGEATKVSIVLGAFKVLMTGVAVATVDRVGRRPLLLYGVSALTAALFLLGWVSRDSSGGLSSWWSVAALLMYVSAYQVSFGPISWLLVGEVFPLKVRGQAIALASLTNFGSNFAVSLFLPMVQERAGMASTYFIFGFIGIAAVLTLYSLVPETKGKTLEEIEALWSTSASRET